VVVACYGMNDGIYHPFSEERFKQYQAGFRKLIEKAKKTGATVVLMTPAPFDPRPVRKKLLPASAERFSWMRPYENYDDVLTRYSEWLLTLRKEGFTVVDAHAAVLRHLAAARKSDPAYHVSGDGIHPNAAGHWVIARELLLAWHAPADVDAADLDAKTGKAARGDVRDLAADKAGVRFTWRTRLPLPVSEKERPLAAKEGINDRLNRHRLTVGGLPAGRYTLAEGDRRLSTVTADALAAGVELLQFPELTSNRRSAEVGKLVAERQQLLGLAWLTAVGHKRPDTTKGLPLEEAQAKAAGLEKRIRELARPVDLRLRLTEAAPGLQGTGK
jgi:hypothetical protein